MGITTDKFILGDELESVLGQSVWRAGGQLHSDATDAELQAVVDAYDELAARKKAARRSIIAEARVRLDADYPVEDRADMALELAAQAIGQDLGLTSNAEMAAFRDFLVATKTTAKGLIQQINQATTVAEIDAIQWPV